MALGAGVDSAWEQKKTRSQNAFNAESSPLGEHSTRAERAVDVQRTEEVQCIHLPWGSARVILVLVQDALLGGVWGGNQWFYCTL